MFKRIFSIFLFIFLFFPEMSYSQELRPTSIETGSKYVFQGHAEVNDQRSAPNDIFTGETDTLGTKNVIKMTVSQVLSESYSEEGDEFFAEVTSEVVGDKGVVLQRGTIAHGRVRELQNAKRLGRDGFIELDFDYLITPDGREIPIEGKMTTKSNLAVGVAKNVAINTGYTAAGAAIGGMVALNILGIEAAVASQGYTLAGGAAVGGAVGLGMGLYRKGKEVLLQPGNEIKVRVRSSVELPVLSDKAFKKEEFSYKGLNVRINNVKYSKDPFGEMNTITLSLSVNNFTQRNFSSFDIALLNDKDKFFYPSVFADSDMMFKAIKAGDRIVGKLAFSVDNIKDSHWLVFLDRSNGKPLARISIDGAIRDIEQRKKEAKHHKKAQADK